MHGKMNEVHRHQGAAGVKMILKYRCVWQGQGDVRVNHGAAWERY